MVLQWLPCQVSGVIGSRLGLVGLVSVYCDWMRQQVWSPTSVSMWQHIEGSRPEWCISNMIYSRDRPFWLETLDIELSEKICPWDMLACCCDVKQPVNKNNIVIFLPYFFLSVICCVWLLGMWWGWGGGSVWFFYSLCSLTLLPLCSWRPCWLARSQTNKTGQRPSSLNLSATTAALQVGSLPCVICICV